MSEEILNTSNFLFYRSSDGKTTARVIASDETVWMTQKSMGDVFNTSRENISMHLSNIFKEGELEEDSVCKVFLHTADDGKSYRTKFYNLDAIIGVGYRVNSYQATQFRIWATKILKEYLVKGFAMDDERLKQGKTLFGKDYFDELIERIREIRASERRFYQKITDIYALSIDYDPKAPITQTFFQTVQNKMEFAITHMTASEIVRSRANASKPHMGLTSWKNQGTGGKILKTDISVAKNYLDKSEIDELNTIVSMYLDGAELFAKKHKEMRMADWVDRLDAFLKFNQYDILSNAGTVKSIVAKAFAEKQFEKFRVVQDREYKSDFDKVVEATRTKQLPKEVETTFDEFSEIKKPSAFDATLKGMLSVPPAKDENKKDDKKK